MVVAVPWHLASVTLLFALQPFSTKHRRLAVVDSVGHGSTRTSSWLIFTGCERMQRAKTNQTIVCKLLLAMDVLKGIADNVGGNLRDHEVVHIPAVRLFQV